MYFAHLGQIIGFTEVGDAVIRAGLAGDHVHHGGLAGTVGADDAAQFTDADIQGQVGQRLETIEADVDVFQGQDGAVTHVQALGRSAAKAEGVAAGAGILIGIVGRFEHQFG